MFVMLAQQLDGALGLSNLSSKITQYLPAEHVASFATLVEQVPASFTLPSPAVLLVWSMAAIMALAVLEQVKYQIGRIGKGGKQLPGAAGGIMLLTNLRAFGWLVRRDQQPRVISGCTALAAGDCRSRQAGRQAPHTRL